MGFAKKLTLKYKREFEWTVLNVIAPANHIQAAASWLATAAQPAKWYPPPGSEFLSQLRIPSLQNQISQISVGEFSRAE